MRKAIVTSVIFLVVCFLVAFFEILPGMTQETVFQYHGLDYAGIFFVLIAQKLLETKDKRAFIVYIIGLVLNGVFGYVISSYSIILFSIYSGWIFITNYLTWTKDEKSN